MAKINTIKLWEVKNKKMKLSIKWNESETFDLVKKYEEEAETIFGITDTKDFLDFTLKYITSDFSWMYDKYDNLHIWDMHYILRVDAYKGDTNG